MHQKRHKHHSRGWQCGPLESTAETQLSVQPALLSLSPINSQYFTHLIVTLLCFTKQFPNAMKRAICGRQHLLRQRCFCSAVAATEPPVAFESPCECRDNHGKQVKNNPSTPPTHASAVQSVVLSDIFSWSAPPAHLAKHAPQDLVRRERNILR